MEGLYFLTFVWLAHLFQGRREDLSVPQQTSGSKLLFFSFKSQFIQPRSE